MSRLADVFNEALTRPAGARPAYVEQACAGDPELRVEVESLLSYHRGDTVTDTSESGGTVDERVRRARSLAGRWFTREGRQRFALLAGLAAAFVFAAGLATHQALRLQLQKRTTQLLEAATDAGVTSYREWIEGWRDETLRLTRDVEVRARIRQLVAETQGREIDAASTARLEPHRELEGLLDHLRGRTDVINVNVLNRESLVVFFLNPASTPGVYRLSPRGAGLIAPVFTGEAIVTPPHLTGANVAGAEDRDGTPQIVIAVPVPDEKGQVVAAVSLRFRSEPEITRRLRGASDESIETYAFDGRGVMVSRPGNEETLQTAGLLAGDRIASLHVAVRDPGVNLADGPVPLPDARAAWPLTRMALRAQVRQSGVDVDGYRDFTGRLVAGAWRWLPDYGVGIASEIGVEQAYAPLLWVKGGFVSATLLLALFALGAGIGTMSPRRWRERLVIGTQLGQYRLEETIGQGGMAKVYRARHESLPREMAIKLLEIDAGGPEARARFEREVRLVSHLRHPNTVQVFDYGQTPDGRLFYVMELVPGLNLREIVEIEGALPAGRAVWILGQICGSLREAHDLGIVHRDIKPANVMVSERAGHPDVVTVLDFGLARTMGHGETQLTQQSLLGGTPAYIPPERIEEPSRVDARSDIYSLGAVAYFLLTGREVVEGLTPQETLLKTMQLTPERPSLASPGAVPEALDRLVLRCLDRDPAARPQNARDLRASLEALGEACPWTEAQSLAWWERHRRTPSRTFSG